MRNALMEVQLMCVFPLTLFSCSRGNAAVVHKHHMLELGVLEHMCQKHDKVHLCDELS